MKSPMSTAKPQEVTTRAEGVTRPLDYFYQRSGLELPYFRELREAEVPEPFHRLLVHVNDMTPTLEAFYGDDIELRVLTRQRRGGEYWREVVLVLRKSGRPVEFGANRVLLDRFPEAARKAILEEKTPLGHIMRDFQVRHVCRPRAFLTMDADKLVGGTLGLNGQTKLYGRNNRLYGLDGAWLSEVVEILRPPAMEH